MNIIFQIIGFLAAFLCTVSFLPQMIQVIKTRSTKDISLGMFLILSMGVLCWLIYGIYLGSLPMIVSNGVGLTMNIIILVYKIKYK